MRRRTEGAIEMNKVWVIRRPEGPVAAWCPECGEAGELLSPKETVVLTGVSAGAIYWSVEEGPMPQAETAESFLLVCRRCAQRRRSALLILFVPSGGPRGEQR